jgi:hypothetical protein
MFHGFEGYQRNYHGRDYARGFDGFGESTFGSFRDDAYYHPQRQFNHINYDREQVRNYEMLGLSVLNMLSGNHSGLYYDRWGHNGHCGRNQWDYGRNQWDYGRNQWDYGRNQWDYGRNQWDYGCNRWDYGRNQRDYGCNRWDYGRNPLIRLAEGMLLSQIGRMNYCDSQRNYYDQPCHLDYRRNQCNDRYITPSMQVPPVTIDRQIVERQDPIPTRFDPNGDAGRAGRVAPVPPQLSDCTIAEQKSISYGNGKEATLTLNQGDKSKVEEFISADGVKYKRVELGVAEREMLSSKLGHEPPPGYAAWVVEGGGISRSNGNSDRKIIADISFDPSTQDVKVKTVWPVPQETNYLQDGSFVHGFRNGARQTTRVSPAGTTLTQEWPGNNSAREITTTPDGKRRITDRDKTTGKETDVTAKYEIWGNEQERQERMAEEQQRQQRVAEEAAQERLAQEQECRQRADEEAEQQSQLQ